MNMKQPAISSLFHSTKHYAKNSSVAAKDAKSTVKDCQLIDTHDRFVNIEQQQHSLKNKKGESTSSFKVGLDVKSKNEMPSAYENKGSQRSVKTASSTKRRQSPSKSKSRKPRKVNAAKKEQKVAENQNIKGLTAKTVQVQQDDSTAAADTLSTMSQDLNANGIDSGKSSSRRTNRNKKRQLKDATKDQSEVQLSDEQIKSNKRLKRASPVRAATRIETIPETKEDELVSPQVEPNTTPLNVDQTPPNNVSSALSQQTKDLLSRLKQSKNQSIAQPQATETSPKPLLLPSKQIPSSSTLSLIKQIRQKHNSSAKQSPIAHLLSERDHSQQSRDSSIQKIATPQSQISNRLKYEDLLKTTRTLVLPLHMKNLLDLCRYLDEALNFYKKCGRLNTQSNLVFFSDLKTSVEKSRGKAVGLQEFRKVLAIDAGLFSHGWERRGGKYELTVDFGQQWLGQKLFGFVEKRQENMKEKCVELCMEAYKREMVKRTDVIEDQYEAQLIADPVKYQMWHHTFDPHTMVPQVKPATLTSPPQIQHSTNMREFLKNAGGSTSSIVRGALEQSRLQANLSSPESSKTKETEEEREQRMKLEKLSKETGISMDTLRTIKSVEDKVSANRLKNEKYMQEQQGKKDHQSLVQLANQIRFIFQMKRVTTIQMNQLVQQLAEKSQGEFTSKEERIEQIEKLAKIEPRWMMIKSVGSHGKVVKCNNQVSQLAVKSKIEESIKAYDVEMQGNQM